MKICAWLLCTVFRFSWVSQRGVQFFDTNCSNQALSVLKYLNCLKVQFLEHWNCLHELYVAATAAAPTNNCDKRSNYGNFHSYQNTSTHLSLPPQALSFPSTLLCPLRRRASQFENLWIELIVWQPLCQFQEIWHSLMNDNMSINHKHKNTRKAPDTSCCILLIKGSAFIWGLASI